MARLTRIGLALMAVNREDAEAAGELYDLLEPGQRGMAVLGIRCYQRVLGLLSQYQGQS